jgi:CHAT domain-containing protein
LENRSFKYYSSFIKAQLLDELSYNQYWKPIADRITGAKKIYVSSDGIYNQINLNTLYNPATGKYVIDEVRVQAVTSTRDILSRARKTNLQIKGATLFGYPNYGNANSSKPETDRAVQINPKTNAPSEKANRSAGFLSGAEFKFLPGTKVEVGSIDSMLQQNNISTRKFLFDEATEAEIKKLSNPQVLHIATHGFFLTDLAAPHENERDFGGMQAKKIVENPLLRSGLLLAGAWHALELTNATTTAGSNDVEEDGILTAYEAMSLNLDQTDLVVMSACETGLGVTSNGEGVYGLQRAFQVAGAKSVLMSLWKVDDEASKTLMTFFYENWIGGQTQEDAFRNAQLSLRKKFSDPKFWGPFVMVGN